MTALLTIISLFVFPSLYFIWQDMKTRQPTSKRVVAERRTLPPSPIQNPQAKIQNRYEGDILDELAKTTLHILFGVMSGGGKSTSMKAIIWKIHQINPHAKFYIIDPKTTGHLEKFKLHSSGQSSRTIFEKS